MSLFSRAWYEVRGNELYVILKEEGRFYEVLSDLKPYFFIKEKDKIRIMQYTNKFSFDILETNLVNLNNEKVIKIVMKTPKEVGAFVKKLEDDGIETYEGDIPYVRRFMIDKGLKIKENFRKIYFDVECEISFGKSVEELKIISLALINDKDERFYKAGSEKEILNFFLETIKDYDMVLGYNIENFDLVVIKNALKRNNMKEELNTLEKENCFFDIMRAYEWQRGGKKESYKLEDVCLKELGEGKIKIDKAIFRDYNKLNDEEREKLKQYNFRDVELIKKLDEKLGLSEIRILLAREGYIFPEETFSISKLHDSILLKRYRNLGYVLPTKRKEIEKGAVKGALIIPYANGLFENVAVYDVKSLYPTVMKEFRISPEKEKIVIPILIEEWMNKRNNAKKKYNETKNIYYKYLDYVYKIAMNSLYGYFIASFTRLFDTNIGNMITGYGRMVLKNMIDFFEEKGIKVLAADTDSCFISLPFMDMNIAEEILAKLNEYLRNKLKKDIEVELKKIYSKIYFSGAKKRYVGFVKYIDKQKLENEILDVVGFELIRGDWFNLSKKLEEEIFIKILDKRINLKEEVEKMLLNIKNELYNGKVDIKDLAISISSVKKNSKVKTRQKRALEKLEKAKININNEDKISFIVGEGNEVYPLVDGVNIFNGKPDYNFYFMRLIKLANRITGIDFSYLLEPKKKKGRRKGGREKDITEFLKGENIFVSEGGNIYV